MRPGEGASWRGNSRRAPLRPDDNTVFRADGGVTHKVCPRRLDTPARPIAGGRSDLPWTVIFDRRTVRAPRIATCSPAPDRPLLRRVARNLLGTATYGCYSHAEPPHLGGAKLLRDSAESSEFSPSYLVVVAAAEQALYHYLKQRFEPDSSTRVILDRRRRLAPGSAVEPPVSERRRAHTAEILSSQRVAVIRLTDEPVVSRAAVNDPAGQGRRESMEGMEGLEDRQRVDRWLEESQ